MTKICQNVIYLFIYKNLINCTIRRRLLKVAIKKVFTSTLNKFTHHRANLLFMRATDSQEAHLLSRSKYVWNFSWKSLRSTFFFRDDAELNLVNHFPPTLFMSKKRYFCRNTHTLFLLFLNENFIFNTVIHDMTWVSI
jgi:hypothetical protein